MQKEQELRTNVDEKALEAFRAGFRGRLIRPQDDTYDEARKVYNAMIDKRPALIAQCADVADVIQSVNFARDQHLLLAIRGGGHKWPRIGDV